MNDGPLEPGEDVSEAVEAAWGTPAGSYAAVEADVDPTYLGREADTATLRVTWQPTPTVYPDDERPDPDDPSTPGLRTSFDAMFRVHYREPGGYDCGFHKEPNPHVDGGFHVQWRRSPDDSYEYEPASLQDRTPVGALREILPEFESTLGETSLR